MDTSVMCPYCLRENALEYGQCRFCHKKSPDNLPLGILPPGTVLGGRYVTGMYLGAGGYGITYRALDLMTNSRVAIKEYRPKQFCERSSNRSTLTILQEEEYRYGLKHFYTEVEILASLQNIPEVVRYYNSFAENNTAYYVMEFLDSGTLQHLLKERKEPMSFSEAVELLLPVILAFHRVHEVGVLHRDISPDNIFIGKDGSVRLIDFGASRTQTSSYSNSFMPVEKEGYSPPEQHTLDREGKNQGPWSDVYAMAGTMYHCVVGRRPPTSSARLAGDRLDLPDGRKMNNAQREALEKGLALNWKERYSDMLSFARGIVGALKEKDAQVLREKYPILQQSIPEGSVSEEERPKEPWVPLNSPTSEEPHSAAPDSPGLEVSVSSPAQMIRQVFAFLIDILLFQGVPFAISRLLGFNVWICLGCGYFIGVIICAYLLAYFTGSTPGQMILGLQVQNSDNSRPNGKEATAYSFIYLLWPLIPVKLIFKLISGINLDTSISHCSVFKTEQQTISHKPKGVILRFEEGVFKGNEIPLKPGTHIFGRDPEKCNMIYPLDYTTVSREQFTLIIDKAGNISVKDTSSFGTWLNHAKLPKNNEVRVSTGSEIVFGNNKEKIIITN